MKDPFDRAYDELLAVAAAGHEFANSGNLKGCNAHQAAQLAFVAGATWILNHRASSSNNCEEK